VSIGGDGIFDVALGQTFTVNNPQFTGDRKWNKGKGKFVARNASVYPLSAWTGAIGGVTHVIEDVDSSETAISVHDASAFGPAPFAIAIDAEVMWCTLINTSTDVLTVERGFDGTTAVMHHPTTTLNGGIDADDATITVTTGTAMGYAPFYILVDSELMQVTIVDGNTWYVTRGVGGTSAASHSNGATLTKRPEVLSCITTVMRDGILESLAGGGILRGVTGVWATTGGWDLPSGAILTGSGSVMSTTSGCIFRQIVDNTYTLKIGSNKSSIYVSDWAVDSRNAIHSTPVRMSGTQAGGATQNCKFVNCRLDGGMWNVNVYDEIDARAWQCTSILFDHCWFVSGRGSSFRVNTSNTNFMFNGCTFSPVSSVETTLAEEVDISETAIDVADASVFGAAPFYIMVNWEQMYVTSVTGNTLNLGTESQGGAGTSTGRGANGTYAGTHLTGAAVYRPPTAFRGFYHGPTLFNNCTFNGTNVHPQNIHCTISSINTTTGLITTATPHGIPIGELSAGYIRPLQSMSITAAVTSVTAGNARCIVTASGMTNSPKTVTFAVANSDTAAQVAGKARVALAADVDVAAWFTVSGSSADITLTRVDFTTSHDGTMNFTLEDVTSGGITDDTTATDVTDDRCPTANRYANDATAIELGKQRIWLKGVTLTTAYPYLNPRTAFLGDEADYRIDFADSGTGTLQLCTNMPTRAGRPFAVAHVSHTNGGIQFTSCQDEGFPYWLVVDGTFEKQKWIRIDDSWIQSQIHVRSQTRLDLNGNWMYANALTDLASASYSVDVDAYLKNNSITYASIYGGYYDMGIVLQGGEKSIDAFCGNSVVYEDTTPDAFLNHSKAPSLTTIGGNFPDWPTPALEITRDRTSTKFPIARFGLKNAWNQRADEKFHEVNILDSIASPTYAWMHDWLEIGFNPGTYYTLARDGRYLSGHLAYRGRLVNVNANAFAATTGTITHNFSLGEVHYFSAALTGDVTLHVSATAGEEVVPFERKYIFIPTGSTSRIVTLGDRFYARGTKTFYTGAVTGYWVLECYAFGGNQLMVASREFVTSDGTGPDLNVSPWRNATSTSVQLVSNVCYLSNNSSLVTFTLPTMAQIGDFLKIAGTNTGGFKIAQNASGYQIWDTGTDTVGVNRTTTGTGGSLQTLDSRDSIELVCVEANNGWQVVSAKGSFTVT
jgi:hypothetical protein